MAAARQMYRGGPESPPAPTFMLKAIQGAATKPENAEEPVQGFFSAGGLGAGGG